MPDSNPVPRAWPTGAILALATACTLSDSRPASVRAEIDSTLRAAYDLSAPDVERRMLALYPDSGAIVSASAGRVTTSRDSLVAGIQYFWRSVGVNMRDPRWIWDSLHVDVLSPRHAVVTGSYRIEHLNPHNQPHVLGGAVTMVFEKRGSRWLIVQEHLSDRPQVP